MRSAWRWSGSCLIKGKEMINVEAIVLAGGFGTRLANVVKDVPKPMAPVCGKPFLEYVLRALLSEGVGHIVLAVGYKKECIIEKFGSSFLGVPIDYSVEETPLYTGGAVKQALNLCEGNRVFAVNGDTYYPVRLREMRRFAEDEQIPAVMAVKRMEAFSRYGTVCFDPARYVTSFQEKRFCTEGYINGGVYDLNRNILEGFPDVFSLENDCFPRLAERRELRAFCDDAEFIDIGIPEDYLIAQKMFHGVLS